MTFREYVMFLKLILNEDLEERARFTFQIIDTNSNGFFKHKDIINLIHAQDTDSKSSSSFSNANKAGIVADYIFSKLRVSKDEEVTLKRFLLMVNKDPSIMDILSIPLNGVPDSVLIQSKARLKLHYISESLTSAISKLQRLQELRLKKSSTSGLESITICSSISIYNKKAVKKSLSSLLLKFGRSTIDSIDSSIQFSARSPEPPAGPQRLASYPIPKILNSKVENIIDERDLDTIAHETDIGDIIDALDKLLKTVEEEKEILQEKEKELPEVKLSRHVTNKLPRMHSEKGSLMFITHQNWSLMLNMMSGIQKSINSISSTATRVLNKKDFTLRYTFELNPSVLSLKYDVIEDRHSPEGWIFMDYAPNVFLSLRRIFNITNEEYLQSIGSDNLVNSLMRAELGSFMELTSSGKSGSFFYYSSDGRYILKTIARDEFKTLMSILPSYYEHVKRYPATLATRFFGLHSLLDKKRKKLYFVIMNNVFETPKEIHERYDIKGSSYKRTTDPQKNWTIARKDLDFVSLGKSVYLHQQDANKILNQIEADSNFFAKNDLLDYSLLIGIHKVPIGEGKIESEMTSNNSSWSATSPDNSHIYFIGIIDFLTSYKRTTKKLESFIKKTCFGVGVSCVPPLKYASRFRNFVQSSVISIRGG